MLDTTDDLVTTGADADGTGTGAMVGGGIAGTLAALPIPEGSLIEPLSPRAFAGPGGMPLTPASWAGALEGTARKIKTAILASPTGCNIHPRENIEPCCARLMVSTPVPACHIVLGKNLKEELEARTWKHTLKFHHGQRN